MNPQLESTHYLDAGAVAVGIASIAGWLPNIAALLTVLWMLIRIWETDTVRNWVRAEQKAHETRVVRQLERKVLAEDHIIEKAKEELKPVVVEEVIAALPILPEVKEAIKEKVLSNDPAQS